jgi:hypothetical protein
MIRLQENLSRLMNSFGAMKYVSQCACVCLLSFVAGCGDTDTQKPDGDNWAILTRPASQGSSWRLEASAVPEILTGAKAQLERELARTTHDLDRSNIMAILAKWDAYSCQIFPVIQKGDGRKVAVLSFFPTRDITRAFKDWRNVPVLVEGGSYDFWTVTYDPEKKEYLSFAVNAQQ